ncbi:MAG: helix-turn-helix domain-containing protein [Cyanobacteriota bacterium]|nr:helix-turn-helix domain-containing protein [Cyanobacteriota bacterium]
MAATRLNDRQKQELVERYSAGEGSADLAAFFGCSVHTVGRVVKAALTPEEHERLKLQRARGSRAVNRTASPPPEPVKSAEATVLAEASSAEAEFLTDPPSSDPGGSLPPTGGTLAIEDADDFGDDGSEDDSSDPSDDSTADLEDDATAELPTAPHSQDPVNCLPLAEAQLPGSVYMLVDKVVELDARPLSSFSDLGLLPPGEEERQALQVFVNPRNAKRLCGRSQRVIKIPDTRIFERTAPFLLAQGISRVVIENGLYSLPGA